MKRGGGDRESGDSDGSDDGDPPGSDDEPPGSEYNVESPRASATSSASATKGGSPGAPAIGRDRSTSPATSRRLPGVEDRPWLREPHPPSCRAFGTERRDERGRVRVTLGAAHPYANSGGWQYRYRLVVAYALGRALRSDEHLDHINGVVDDDRLSNLRLLTPEIHGRLHAWLFELAGCRGEDGRFSEYAAGDVEAERACRLGPVISAREIDPLTWLPLSERLVRELR